MLKEFGIYSSEAPREVASEFAFQTQCVASLYRRFFKNRQKIKKVWKVLVEIVRVVDRTKSLNLIGALEVKVQGNVEEFFQLDAQHKKEASLKYLMEGIRWVAKEQSWDISEFEAVEKQIRDCNFENTWTWKSPVKNASKTRTAEVVIEHDVSEARLFMRFRDKKGAVVKQNFLVSEKPDELIFYKHLGKLQWLDDSSVVLISRSGNERIESSVD